MRFLYIVLIFFIISTQSIFANSSNENDLSFSVHLGASKGCGFGLTYNIFDNIDITINTVPIFEFGDSKKDFLLFGLSIDYYVFSSDHGLYFTLPSVVYNYSDFATILSGGFGYKQSLDEKTYLSYSLTAGVLIEKYDSEYRFYPIISPGLTFGYIF